MGFGDILFGALEIVSALSDIADSKQICTAKCTSLEIFEIGTEWRGTARVHGAGRHVKTEKMNLTKKLTLPKEGTSQYTPRGLLRRDFRAWAGENMAANKKPLTKDAVVLNDSESCLSVEGFIKKADGKWLLTITANDAQYYGSFKVVLIDEHNTQVDHKELHYLFKAETLGRVSSIDVTDSF